jgi:broad specificity phosphatase PhoE
MTENTKKKTFSLIVVRHGEGFHNLATHKRSDLEFTDDANFKTINSSLTEKGLMQANLLADRLKYFKFDLAITSDLKRAMQTAEAIMEKNESINELTPWRIIRERCIGDFEGVVEPFMALITVENAVEDRDYLTWRPPNGESVVDLRKRVIAFLEEIQKEAMKLPGVSPLILVSSHGLFMAELFRVISAAEYGETLPKKLFYYQNTGMAQYYFTTRINANDEHVLEKVECPIVSCANHLENYDEDYVFCKGGCHGVPGEENRSKFDKQP